MSSRLPSVLVVDDDEAIRTALERALNLEGFVVSAVDGGAALDAVAADQPDLLVLDVVMPDVDGVAVARTLRDQGRELPILILSALDEVDDRVAGLQAGADDYLVKPVRRRRVGGPAPGAAAADVDKVACPVRCPSAGRRGHGAPGPRCSGG